MYYKNKIKINKISNHPLKLKLLKRFIDVITFNK